MVQPTSLADIHTALASSLACSESAATSERYKPAIDLMREIVCDKRRERLNKLMPATRRALGEPAWEEVVEAQLRATLRSDLDVNEQEVDGVLRVLASMASSPSGFEESLNEVLRFEQAKIRVLTASLTMPDRADQPPADGIPATLVMSRWASVVVSGAVAQRILGVGEEGSRSHSHLLLFASNDTQSDGHVQIAHVGDRLARLFSRLGSACSSCNLLLEGLATEQELAFFLNIGVLLGATDA